MGAQGACEVGRTAYPAGLIDTDILIDASRGLPEAGAFLDEQQEGAGILISVISAMELIGGCRDAAQLREVQRFLQQVTVLPLTAESSLRARALMERFTRSHGLLLADTLIAATALEAGLPLYTRNVLTIFLLPPLGTLLHPLHLYFHTSIPSHCRFADLPTADFFPECGKLLDRMSQTAFIPISTIEFPMTYRRRKTRVVQVGDVKIGGDNPIVVQSMITAETMNTPAAVEQIIELYEAGAEIVRVTAPNLREAQNLAEIRAELKRRGYGHIPLVADVHHQGMDIALEAAKHVQKVRINPGLFVYRKPDPTRTEYSESEIQEELEAIERAFRPVIQACKEYGIAMRIGVNHGSLSERMKVMYGDSPLGMVESALEYIRICEAHGFRDIVISLKASRVPVMLAVNRLMAARMAKEGMDYPLHLGVTEAGDGVYARIKSSIGIGTLLAEGIGDTIRVSLAEDPVNEIEVCYDLLQALGLRKTKVEYIACPSCGRTKFDLPTVLNEVREATKHLVGLDIAVMGCIVNGPGEMADADYGYVGRGPGKIALYRKGELVKNDIPAERGVEELITLLKTDGAWRAPD